MPHLYRRAAGGGKVTCHNRYVLIPVLIVGGLALERKAWMNVPIHVPIFHSMTTIKREEDIVIFQYPLLYLLLLLNNLQHGQAILASHGIALVFR